MIKNLFAMVLILAILFLMGGCAQKQEEEKLLSKEQESVTSVQSTESVGNAESVKITLNDAEKIAEELIIKYQQYLILGVCCENEYNDIDMSNFLTQTQRLEYSGVQYKITCCKSLEEIKEHRLKYIDISIRNEYDDQKLFRDTKGDWYAYIPVMGFEGGESVIDVTKYTNTKIIATETTYDQDRNEISSDTYTIVKINDDFVIKSVK